MASKKYAYYNKGNKIAIVQEESTGSGGNLAVAHCTLGGYTTKDTCEAAGGQWIPSSSSSFSGNRKYVSPTESVADGLEIEYTYSPIYRVSKARNEMDTQYYVQGWTVLDGYLTFVRNILTSPQNWAVATSGSEGDTGGQSLDYILVSGSSRWNGIHKVQTAGGSSGLLGGMLKTYTKVDNIFPYVSGVDLDCVTQSVYDGDGSDDIRIADLGFAVGDYVFLSGFAISASNNGVYLIDTLTSSATDTSSKLNFKKKYYMPVSNSQTPSTEIEATAAFVTDTIGGSLCTVAKIEHEISLVTTNINVLNDEDDEIDLTSYQSKAIVYYLKAKMAEDGGDFKQREYFIREFKRQLEKERSARKRGPYIAMGNANMRTL